MRLVTYRAYKFNFTAAPTEPPTLKAYVYAAAAGGPNAVLTICWVSWNGATEVSWWNFYGASKTSSPGLNLVGSAKKSGFETMFTAAGYLRWVIAEAVAANGSILGRSEKQETIVPQGISVAGFGNEENHEDTPGIFGSLLGTGKLQGNGGDGKKDSSSAVDQAQKSFLGPWGKYVGVIFACIALGFGVYFVGFDMLWLFLGRLKFDRQKYVLLNH
jgi:hypothetical protein